jgi:hypothetical protein
MNKILGYITILAFGTMMSGCDLGNDPEPGGTKVQAMAGEWWIKVLVGTSDVAGGYHLITTANTAANTDTDLQLDDGGLWPAKIVAKVDMGSLTFTPVSNLSNMSSSTIKVSIIEGKVVKGGATTTGNNTTDLISVKFQFSDDPGTTYEYTGYRRTGFQEDEH